MHAKRIFVSFLLAVLLFIAGSARANLITNGDFATNATGWTLTTPCGFTGAAGNPAGSMCLNAFGDAGSDPSVSQLISGLVIGVTYGVLFDIGLHGNFGGAQTNNFAVRIDGSNVFLTQNSLSAFQGRATSFVATATSHTILFAAEIGGSDVSYYLDNVSVDPLATSGVPEPSAFALIGVALAALALHRQRRTR